MKEKQQEKKQQSVVSEDKQLSRIMGRAVPSLSSCVLIHPQALLIKQQLQSRIVGQDELVYALVLAVFSGKHALVLSLPGLAKTSAIKTLASCLGLQFSRIQATPDLLPSDICGLETLSGEGSFIKKGPLFAQMILVDEINRTTPKVQSALLQAMEERQVTIGSATLDLPFPFYVFATANPSSKGIYALPDAQLDRFALCIQLDYPSDEKRILELGRIETDIDLVPVQIDYNQIREAVHAIVADNAVLDYITQLIQSTRTLPQVQVGCSPRAAKDLLWLGKTLALLMGKKSVATTDIDCLIDLVLAHRIVWKR